MGSCDEVPDHLLGVLEVGDHAVAKGAHRDNVSGGSPEHAPGFCPHREHLAGAPADRHDRRLVEHDAPPAHVNESVGGAEVDADVGRPQTKDCRE
jgi:hypothetical protein